MLARLISSSMLAGMVAVDQPHHDAIILVLTPPPLVTSRAAMFAQDGPFNDCSRLLPRASLCLTPIRC